MATGYCRLGIAQKAAARIEESTLNFQKSVDLLQPLAIRSDFANRSELSFCMWQLASATKTLLAKQKKDFSPALPLLEKAWLTGAIFYKTIRTTH